MQLRPDPFLFVTAGAVTSFVNASLQAITSDSGTANIFSALYNGYATTAGGLAFGELKLAGPMGGLASGLLSGPINTFGNAYFSSVNSSNCKN